MHTPDPLDCLTPESGRVEPAPRPGEVFVVGITDAGPSSLTAEARHAIDAAELLCGGERHLAFFPDHPAPRLTIKANLADLVACLAREERRVVVLASGDPMCFGIGPLLVDRLGRERVRILPNVSAVQLAFARLAMEWQDATLLSAHGRPLTSILPAALRATKVAIFTDERNTPGAIAEALLAAGDDPGVRAIVFEHLAGPAERQTELRLGELRGRSFAPLNTLVLLRERPAPLPLGLPDEAFVHRGGMITKAEVRAVSVGRLRLHERAVLWDLGAGCGSVSIEASGIAHRGVVFAVERDPIQLSFLRENCRRFGAGNVHVVEGQAPDALRGLPRPDAVFVGGSGGQLRAILETAMQALPPQGRIVANFASVEHLAEALATAREHGWATDVAQIAVARGADAAGATRLAALNPVFVATLLPGAAR